MAGDYTRDTGHNYLANTHKQYQSHKVLNNIHNNIPCIIPITQYQSQQYPMYNTNHTIPITQYQSQQYPMYNTNQTRFSNNIHNNIPCIIPITQGSQQYTQQYPCIIPITQYQLQQHPINSTNQTMFS